MSFLLVSFLQMAWSGIWAQRSDLSNCPIPAASRNQPPIATKLSPIWESSPSTLSTQETGTRRAWSTSWARGSWAWPSHLQHPRHLRPRSLPATSPALSVAPWRITSPTWNTSTLLHRPTLDAERSIKTHPRSSPPPPAPSRILRRPTRPQNRTRTLGCSPSSRTTLAFSSLRARGTCSPCPTANRSRARWTRSACLLR